MDVHSISLRAIVSATESEDRVKTALSLFLFDNEISVVNTEGHFGNPISILSATIKGKDCKRFLELLKNNLIHDEILKLKNEVCDRVDEECCFHIRFDKQEAYLGNIKLAHNPDVIAVQIKIKAYPAKWESAIEIADKICDWALLKDKI